MVLSDDTLIKLHTQPISPLYIFVERLRDKNIMVEKMSKGITVGLKHIDSLIELYPKLLEYIKSVKESEKYEASEEIEDLAINIAKKLRKLKETDEADTLEYSVSISGKFYDDMLVVDEDYREKFIEKFEKRIKKLEEEYITNVETGNFPELTECELSLHSNVIGVPFSMEDVEQIVTSYIDECGNLKYNKKLLNIVKEEKPEEVVQFQFGNGVSPHLEMSNEETQKLEEVVEKGGNVEENIVEMESVFEDNKLSPEMQEIYNKLQSMETVTMIGSPGYHHGSEEVECEEKKEEVEVVKTNFAKETLDYPEPKGYEEAMKAQEKEYAKAQKAAAKCNAFYHKKMKEEAKITKDPSLIEKGKLDPNGNWNVMKNFVKKFNALNERSLESQVIKPGSLKKGSEKVVQEYNAKVDAADIKLPFNKHLQADYVGIASDIDELMSTTVEKGVIEYEYPENFIYFTELEKAIEKRKILIINERRKELGLGPLKLKGWTDILPQQVPDYKSLEEQKKLISKKGGVNIFSWPIIHRYYNGELLTTVNINDKYVNVTRLLSFAYEKGYTSYLKSLNGWLTTNQARLLMCAGIDRFRDGVPNPLLGRIYKKNIRMAYRISKRIILEETLDMDAHKGVYFHPRIAASIARWISKDFHDFFSKDFEKMYDDYSQLVWEDQDISPYYFTPVMPYGTQLIMYKRLSDMGKKHKGNEVQISIGKSTYIKNMSKDSKKHILYYARAIDDIDAVMKILPPHLRKGKTNSYSFFSQEDINHAIEILRDYDKYPEHLHKIWQDFTFNIENLGDQKIEAMLYHGEKSEEYQKSIGKWKEKEKSKSYWEDPFTFISVKSDGTELKYTFEKPNKSFGKVISPKKGGYIAHGSKV